MTLLIVPLQPIPNQTVTVALNGQTTTITVYLQGQYIFANVVLNGTPIINGAKCNHASYINQYFTPFNGFLFFYDASGLDPVYTDLGITSNLYFSDYDALALDFIAWEKANNLPLVNP